MGLFGNKKVAEENEFEGATEWFKAQAKTAETFNNEDKDMGGARHTKASSHLHSHRGQRERGNGRSIHQGERQEDSPRRIVQARPARGFIQGAHPCNSSQAETCQEHQRNDKGDAKRAERGNRTLNQHFVKAA